MVPRERVFLRRTKRQKFGELLLTNGSISPEQLEEALQLQEQGGGLLGDILVEKGFISETEIVRALSAQYGLPVLRSKDYDVNKEVLKRYPIEFLYSNLVLPFDKIGDLILVLVCDLPSEETIAVLEKDQFEVVFYVSSLSDLQAGLMQYAPVSDEDRRRYISLRRKRFAAKPISAGARGIRPAAPGGPALEEAEADESMAVTESELVGVATGSMSEATGLIDGEEVIEAVEATEPTAGSGEGELLAELDKSWETIFEAAEQNLKKETPPKPKSP